MALAERFKTTGATGIATFLSRHRACDDGFEVFREQGPGSGRLQLKCKGCGQSVGYRGTDLAEVDGQAGAEAPPRRRFSRSRSDRFIPVGAGAGAAAAPARRPLAPSTPPLAPTTPHQGAPVLDSVPRHTVAGGTVQPPPHTPLVANGPVPPAPPVAPSPHVPPATPPAPTAGAPAPPSPPPLHPPREPVPRRPSWLANALIAGAILGGIGLITAGILRSDDEPTAGQTAPLAPEEPGGSATPVPTPEPTPNATPEPTPAPGPGAGPGTGSGPGPALERRRFETFSLGVPSSWRRSDGVPAGGFAPPGFLAPGGGGQVVIYFQSGKREPETIVSEVGSFLSQRHPGGRVSAGRSTRFAKRDAVRIRATYDGGVETATLLAARGFTYVVLARVSEAATPSIERQTRAVLASFLPR